jgi:DNA modification methylase
MDYGAFLDAKARKPVLLGHDAGPLHASLFPFQAAIVKWAVRLGRAAVFADCGLGKTRIQLEWAREMGGTCLIVCPLAVAEQTIAEAAEIGISVRFTKDPPTEPGIWITNYEKLHRFVGAKLDALVLDESSILKSMDGKTRGMLLSEFTDIPFRLCCTATPAPNDISELANHAQFLGIMDRGEVLASFFVHDSDRSAAGGWRLKGHATETFWKWMATWSVYIRRPSDLGFEDDGFILPPLNISQVAVPFEFIPEGELFASMAAGVGGRIAARKASIKARVDAGVAEIRKRPGKWVVWCALNDEADAVTKALGSDAVNIRGADDEDARAEKYAAWRSGKVPILSTKAAIFGWGVNWQDVHQVMFMGLGDSYEEYYQTIRRCWRFGQKSPVEVLIVSSDPEVRVVENVKRKEADAARTAEQVVGAMREYERAYVLGSPNGKSEYEEAEACGESWRILMGDSCVRLKEIPDHSVALSVFSPPFASLYTYSASDRDLGNSRDYEQFYEHYEFLAGEILRVTIPCRRAAVHVQQVTTTMVTHGRIGWRDFRADMVRTMQSAGWIYDGEIVVDKDPQAQAIRTKSKSLMFIQKERDSAWLRPAMADYLLLFRAPGDNPTPVKGDVSNEEWIEWARPIWYNIRESDTLNARIAREDKDERHVCPLQLPFIARCVRLWTNPGETVLDPFAGIGSTGYEAVRLGRTFMGIELKRSYWERAVENLKAAEAQSGMSLFSRESFEEEPADA